MRATCLCIVVIMLSACKRESQEVRQTQTTVRHDTVLPTGLADTTKVAVRVDSDRISTGELADWRTYRNDRLHFEFKYPADLKVHPGFSTYDIMPKSWRAMADPLEPGHAVASVPIIHLTGRDSYPRFFDVEFRVGVSDSLANCRATNGEKMLGPIVINGSTFNQFEFSDAAMMKYISGISYRTGHNGRCYAIEQIRSGSNYHEQSSPNDLSQKRLDDYYYLAGKIVRTFRFLDGK